MLIVGENKMTIYASVSQSYRKVGIFMETLLKVSKWLHFFCTYIYWGIYFKIGLMYTIGNIRYICSLQCVDRKFQTVQCFNSGSGRGSFVDSLTKYHHQGLVWWRMRGYLLHSGAISSVDSGVDSDFALVWMLVLFLVLNFELC